MALSYRKYTASNLSPQLVTSNVIDPNKILGLHQGRNGFANLIICIAEAWYLESVRELTKKNDSAIIDKWWKNYNASQIGQAWCEVFSSLVITEAIKECGVTNLYPKATDSVAIYRNNGGVPQYNWELSNTEISQNGLVQTEDVIFANAFRASKYLKDKLKNNVKLTTTPTPGSRFYRYSEGNSSGHAGIVIAVLDGYFYTIEGNVVIDNNTLDEGVGMYRYPMAAANNSATGFTFFDFANYPSSLGNISCESKDFSYTYTGLDGKTKTRKCYKPPTPPKDVTEDPPDPGKPGDEKPPTPPVKKDCVPADLKLLSTDTQIQKTKKCETITKVIIPSKGILQNTIEMKNDMVGWDIVGFDGAEVTRIPNGIKERNGSALWYGKNKYDQDTGRATRFGMFKDKIGNLYYVLDEEAKQSEQLLISGLMGVDAKNYIESSSTLNEKKLKGSLSGVCYDLRSQINYLGIDTRATDNNPGSKYNKQQWLKNGIINSTNMILAPGDRGLYNYDEDRSPNAYQMNQNEIGLDFNGNTFDYKLPLQKIKTDNKIDLYKLINAIETTVYNEKQGLKLRNPIVIVIRKFQPKPNIISQDFITALNIVGSLGAVVGVPLPLGAILNASTFAQNLESSIKNGVSINNISSIVTSATRFAENIMPDTIKGINKEIEKSKAELSNMLGIGASANLSLQELVGLQTNGATIQAINRVINDIKQLGEDGQLGQYLATAKKTFNQMASGQYLNAEQIIGIDSKELEKYIGAIDNLGAKFIPVDITRIKQGVKFADSLKSFTNLKSEVFSSYVLNKLNIDKTFFDSTRSLFDITNSPLIQELMISGTASKTLGLFPQSPELASLLVSQKNKALSDFNITSDNISSIQDQKASLIAGSLGYDIKVCDIFADETLKSFKKQAEEYARAKIPFVLPPTLDPDVSECYKYEIQKEVGGTIINCPEGWNYDPKTNRCYNETTSVGYDGGGKINFDFNPDIKLDVSVPKCIQSSFGTYVFYFRGIPLAAMRSTDGRWIAAWGGKNYFIDINNCTLLGVPPETTDKPNDLTPTPPAIALPKCITIRNGKYYYNLRYALGLNDGLISKELTDLYANTKTPIGGASPQDLINIANSIGIDTSKVTNNPTVSSALNTVDKVDNLINTLKTTNSSPIVTTGTSTGSLVVNPIVSSNPVSVNPVTSNANAVTSASNSNNPILNVSQAPEEEEAYYMNGKWYLLRGGKYVEIIDCLPKKAEVYKCGIIERDGEYIFTKNGAEYKAVKNFDNDFYVFINGSYYQLDANCNPIIPQPSGKECAECEVLVTKEQQNRIKLEKAFSESKISNDSKIKELMNLLNTQTQKSLELEKQMILRSGNSTNNDSKYNELLAQLQNERERVNELSRLIQQSKTGGNNNDSVIREIITSLNQEKERSQKLEQKIAELEQKKNDNTSSNNSSNSSNEYFNNLNNISTEKSYEKEIFNEKESLPNCITFENGRYYFTGMVQNDTLKLIALNTAKGWVASYQSSYYLIDLANCKLLTGNLRRETNFTGECTDCVQNTQPRIVERSEKIVYGGFKQGLDPEVYEDCEEC